MNETNTTGGNGEAVATSVGLSIGTPTLKLYKVVVQHTVIVRAKDEREAERQGEYTVRHEDNEPDESYATELTNVSQLTEPWDATCRPWGERDPLDRTIGEMLNNQSVPR